MKTINFSTLGLSFQITDTREVVGYKEIGTVYPSQHSMESHEKELDSLRGDTPRKDLTILRYSQNSRGKEWYVCPELKVWWLEDMA